MIFALSHLIARVQVPVPSIDLGKIWQEHFFLATLFKFPFEFVAPLRVSSFKVFLPTRLNSE